MYNALRTASPEDQSKDVSNFWFETLKKLAADHSFLDEKMNVVVFWSSKSVTGGKNREKLLMTAGGFLYYSLLFI